MLRVSNLNPMANQITEFSPSALSLFDGICQQQYFLEYLDEYLNGPIDPYKKTKRKKIIKQQYIEAGERKALVFGGILHDVLWEFFREVNQRNLSSIQEGLLATLEKIWQGPRGKKGGFPDLEEERDYYRKGVQCLETFAQTQNLSPKIAYLPTGVFDEDLLKFPLGENLTLTGKIDRIDKDEGGYHLIDYKTGRKTDDPFQLIAYTLLAENSLGKSPIKKASFVYLQSGETQTFTPTDELKEQTLERIKNIVAQIRERSQKEDFSPKPGRICIFCDYVEFCLAKDKAKKIIAESRGRGSEEALPF